MKWRPDRSFFFFFLVVFASVSMKNCWILYWMYLWNFVKRWTMADTSQNIDRNLFLQNYKIAHWPLWMTRPRKCRSNFCISSLFCSCRSALCYYQSHPHKLFNLCPLARACCVVLPGPVYLEHLKAGLLALASLFSIYPAPCYLYGWFWVCHFRFFKMHNTMHTY